MGDGTVNTEGIQETVKISQPKPTEFDLFLPWACKEFCIPNHVFVIKSLQNVYISTGSKTKTVQPRKPHLVSAAVEDQQGSDDLSFSSRVGEVIDAENIIAVEAIYDSGDRLVQVKFLNNRHIPRQIMQIIALTIPYQKYLTSITINCGLRMDTLYELSKFLPHSQITEVCLDSTFVGEANYHILLTNSKLKHLSLAKCSINDIIAKTIADQLVSPCPASRVLSALNLSSNRITDIGAMYFADVLRTNRQLSYLNIANNMITDKGGISILETLQKFPLHPEELLASRARYVTYLKKRNVLINTLIIELRATNFDKTSKKTQGKKSIRTEAQSLLHLGATNDAQIIQEKAEILAERKLGLFNEAFSLNNTITQDGVVYCFGNNTLCCLNLAYNSLTYTCVKKLHEVLTTQKSLYRTPRGLIKVVIEGNLLPVACEEYKEIDHLLGLGLGGTGLKKQSEAAMKMKSSTRSPKQ